MILLPEFELLLKKRLGLDAASIGSSAVERAVKERMSACNQNDAQAYLDRISTSATELQELIEAVVVPETWFFRDQEAFVALARMVLDEWLPAHPDGVLRLLSLPCATGEEPYSMAMTLLDAGVPSARFHLDAIDVSARALERARTAIYGRNSFRNREMGFRARYFEAVPGGHRIAEAVRRQVRFQQGNLFDRSLLSDPETYDVIFCRNLLIYFDRATQDRAIEVLRRVLAAKGVLFVGPSETGLMMTHQFVSTKVPLAFGFRRAHAIPHEEKNGATVPPRRRRTGATRPVPLSAPVRVTSPAPVKETIVDLDEAAQLADQGRLVEAAKCCEASLREQGPSARAYYLLGLVRDAAGEPADATGFYRKAIYLDPGHHEALLHLALLLEKQGDNAGSKVLNDRARRLELKAKH